MCALEYYTYDDYVQWEGDWELIDGIPLAMSPAPTRKHQSIAGKIFNLIENQIEECPFCEALYEVDYKIGEDTVLRPDVVLTCGETNEAYLTKTPEIVVEVISKATARRDEEYKFSIYEKEQVHYYVLVYPDDLIAKVYKLENRKFYLEGRFDRETYRFEETKCGVTLDFERVFKKFRRSS